jgi:hypothetical protein
MFCDNFIICSVSIIWLVCLCMWLACLYMVSMSVYMVG